MDIYAINFSGYFFHKGGVINSTGFTARHCGSMGVRCNCVSLAAFSGQDETFVRQYNDRFS